MLANRLVSTVCVALGLMIALSTGVFADSIGVVDLERVFSRYRDAVKLQQDIQKRREAYQKVFEEKNAKLEDVKKKAKKAEDVQSFIQKTEAELKPKQEELMKFEAESNRKMAAKIYSVADEVAKEFSIDVVVDKRAVLSGGFDLTDSVVARLNSAASASATKPAIPTASPAAKK